MKTARLKFEEFIEQSDYFVYVPMRLQREGVEVRNVLTYDNDALPEDWDIICNYNYTEYKSIFGHVSRVDKNSNPVEITREGITLSFDRI